MADESTVIIKQTIVKKPIRITKWKAKEGHPVSAGMVLFIYQLKADGEELKYKATQTGTLDKIDAQEGSVVHYGKSLYNLQKCTHTTVMKDMCAECGLDLRKEEIAIQASIPMVHSIPELKVSEAVAQKIGQADCDRLLNDKKLVLLVDLDQTLIHTTNDDVPPTMKDIIRFQLYGPRSPWYYTRLRPGTEEFLEKMSEFFELHICTFGARNYAHTIAKFLDPGGKYFSHRILSRDECFDPTSKKANLKALFPCGDNMVCIIDDREDVWCFAPNLIHVKPYHFFKRTGDINAPPGLDKHENDSRPSTSGVVDLTDIADKNGEVEISEDCKNVTTQSDDDHTKNDEEDGKNDEEDGKNGEEDGKNDEEDGKNDGNKEKSEINDGIGDVHVKNDGELHERNVGDEKSDEMHANNDKGEEMHEKSDGSEEPDENNKMDVDEEEVTGENNLNACDTNKPVNNVSNDVKNNSESNTTVDKNNINNESNDQSKPDEHNQINNKQPAEKLNSTKKIVKKRKRKINARTKILKTKAQRDKLKVPENKPADEDCEKSDVEKNESSNENKESDVGEKTEVEETAVDVIKDNDDYLKTLENILVKIHRRYYKQYESKQAIPDLKEIIPNVRRKVLKGANLVFSGLVPIHMRLEDSKAYKVAKMLGAEVTDDLKPSTTHLVAVRPGTSKTIKAKKRKTIRTVNPEWLWLCAETWEWMDEKKFPLLKDTPENRMPPAHCSSPERDGSKTSRKRTSSGRFMDTINPLMSFSSADLASMECEVDDMFKDPNDSPSESSDDEEQTVVVDDDVNERDNILRELKKISDSDRDSSSSGESMTAEHPKGWESESHTRRKRLIHGTNTEEDIPLNTAEESTADEFPSVKFRRGERLPDDLDLETNSDDSVGDGNNEVDDEDDGEWNMMGAALEREFLSNNG